MEIAFEISHWADHFKTMCFFLKLYKILKEVWMLSILKTYCERNFQMFLPIRSKGKVLRICRFFPILCPSDESLSLDVFVYLGVSLYLVVAIVFAYLPGLASSLHLQLMISSWTSLLGKKIPVEVTNISTLFRVWRGGGGPSNLLTIPPEVFIRQNWYTGVPPNPLDVKIALFDKCVRMENITKTFIYCVLPVRRELSIYNFAEHHIIWFWAGRIGFAAIIDKSSLEI